jgi:hypothetical protein
MVLAYTEIMPQLKANVGNLEYGGSSEYVKPDVMQEINDRRKSKEKLKVTVGWEKR